ncbi:hypothetical protein J2R99_000131 [Rhodopseudomonas julia]|uniref:DUF2793 domain-containing protein n=1 Tax=Rhodopseudomonas julia TaxID=200617 RepID=A0ABU0C190_9BRAD|nr:DUF2793 domain-containing protein [Rhodopseudomonas julia]MDQ0324282.1 hypothetical protein [Rhodopseudomonas julia]
MDTENLSLPTILSAQAQKHITHNEALRMLDALVQLAVIRRDLTAPPADPMSGARYIVAAGAEGVWSGHDSEIAAFQDGAWTFYTPKPGFLALAISEMLPMVFDGVAWVALTSEPPDTLPSLGINTVSETNNRLAVKSDAILFSHDDVTPGSGNMRVALNKATTGADAGFTFQSDYSARALFGLLGSDDFTLKVSSDGSTYHTGLVLDRESGAVTMPANVRFSAYLSYGQNYAAGAWRDMLFNNFRHNDQLAAIIASNVLTFTAPSDGIYLFGLAGTFEAGAGTPSKLQVGLSVNGAPPTGDTIGTTGDAAFVSGETQVQASALLKLAAGDTVNPKICPTGAAGRILANENFFWGTRLP